MGTKKVKNEMIKNYLEARQRLIDNKSDPDTIEHMLPVQYQYLIKAYNNMYRKTKSHSLASEIVMNKLK